jgi:hypothetical protein
MSNVEEMLKDICLVLWCFYVTIMSIKGAFEIEEPHELFIIFMVWTWCIAIPSALRGI